MEAQLFQAKMTEIDPPPDRATPLGLGLEAGQLMAAKLTDNFKPTWMGALNLLRVLLAPTAKELRRSQTAQPQKSPSAQAILPVARASSQPSVASEKL